MITIMSFGKSERTIGRPNQAVSENDGHRLQTIPLALQHGGRTSPIGHLGSCCGRGTQHRANCRGRSPSIISRMRRNRSRGTATSAIWNTV